MTLASSVKLDPRTPEFLEDPYHDLLGQLALPTLLARVTRIEVRGPVLRAPTPMFRNIRRLPVWCRA